MALPRGSRVLAPAVLLAALALGAGAAADDRVVGIVLEISGGAEPPVGAYDELSDRASIKLQPGARVTFVHYATCRVVTAAGGTLYIDRTRYAATGGTIERAEKTDCPTEQRLASNAPGAAGTGAAALIVRGTAEAPRLPGKPVIVLAGARAGEVKAATVRHGDRDLGAMEMTSRTVAWARSLAALPPGRDYTLRLEGAGGARIAELPFSVDAELVTTAPMILRLD